MQDTDGTRAGGQEKRGKIGVSLAKAEEAATMGPAGTEALPSSPSLSTLCPTPSQTKSKRYKKGIRRRKIPPHSIKQKNAYEAIILFLKIVALGQYKIQNNRLGRDPGGLLIFWSSRRHYTILNKWPSNFILKKSPKH